jgi:ArsR family transcriptional regulator
MKKPAHQIKALADATRLRILALLTAEDGELCVCELMAILDLPQSTVSRHLATLRNAGWVEDRRQGVWMYYRLCQGNDALTRELAGLLRRHLPATRQARQDRQALAAFRAGKQPGPCA